MTFKPEMLENPRRALKT